MGGCQYRDEYGVRCQIPRARHVFVLSGPDDDTADHPYLSTGFDRDQASRLSERWRFIRQFGVEALRERDRAEVEGEA